MNKFYSISKIIFVCAASILLIFAWRLTTANKTLSANIRSLIAENRSLKIQADLTDAKYSLIANRVSYFKLKYIDSDSIYHYYPNKSDNYTLLIFFTPIDCGTCLQEIPFWNEIHNKFRDRLNVLGIGAYEDVNTLFRFIKTENIKIPVLFDKNSNLFINMKLDKLGGTPIKVLLSKDGIIINVMKSTFNNLREQKKYIEQLRKIVIVDN